MKAESINGESDERLLAITRHHSESLAGLMVEIFALYNLSRTLHISFDMDEVFSAAENLMKETLGIAEFSIMVLDDDTETLSVWKASSAHYEAMKNVTFEVGEGVCGAVAKTGQAIAVQDVRKDGRFLFYKGAHKNIGSFFSAPLKTLGGKIFGVFNVSKETTNVFREKDMLVFNAVANHVAHAMENSRVFMNSVKSSISDELTELYSKRYFMNIVTKDIANAERLGGCFALLMLDIETPGSGPNGEGKTMEGVLKKVAQTLKNSTRQGDVLARYEGNRIAVLLPGVKKESARIVATKLMEAMDNNVFVIGEDGGTGKLSIAFGCACFPDDGKSVIDILDKAKFALSSAKNLGDGEVRFSVA